MTGPNRDKLVYLRQWVGAKVNVKSVGERDYNGILTNIVFDGTRLSYIMLDDRVLLNFEQVVEISLAK
ncbi:MAG TPA: hypothetical protein PKN86_19820 [Candidatus Obscuribacter sp.]|jgi:hypothetical protein|nr:hypothetical protein [Candidatus Melainabacteria bacterium]MBK8221306.1 hypothetical protein [Candidatus Obscuribacter sp.]MBK9279903.1 hypothetical protein [Candidatus Obscuribacter sp.]MBL8083017.1 hypothetical protein [Candidatus Obscuribacter sp.]MDX1987476.1 hypothetical protein [Candidatus Obscuribacter sp.]